MGYTVTRQVGGAVERNRIRRRLREVVRLSAAGGAMSPGHDYVLIGRRAALKLPFADMKRELDAALGRIHGREREATGGSAERTLPEAGSPASPRRAVRPKIRRNPPSPGLE